LAYLIQLDVDVTGNTTAKLCEVGSEFNIFCTLVPMAMPCEVVLVRVDFFKMAVVAMETGKMLKN
jgi:hypothetical protein